MNSLLAPKPLDPVCSGKQYFCCAAFLLSLIFISFSLFFGFFVITIVPLASLSLLVSMYFCVFFYDKVKKQNKLLLEIKKEEITHGLIVKWSECKGDRKAQHKFIDTMVNWSKQRDVIKLVDFDLIRDFLNSTSNSEVSFHALYSQELERLDHDRQSHPEKIFVQKSVLIARLNFLNTPFVSALS